VGGSLFHAKDFAKNNYTGGDGQPHYELLPINGECIGLGHTTWSEMKDLSELHGMPHNAWPEFLDYDCGIDIPLDAVRDKQDGFRRHLLELPTSVLKQHYWLAKLAEWVQRGESVFFCRT
jgi:hypothetical protein